MTPLAAVTMVYNEPDLLPLWLRHYAGQVGAAHCHVIDHGSDDGSTDRLGEASVLRLPRSPQDDAKRAGFISGYCAALLREYAAVMYTDVDEVVMADPACAATLVDYAAMMPTETINAIGLELLHLPAEEAAIDPRRGVLDQRRWVRFSSALCKPVMTRRALHWAPGFHCADAPLQFDDLYLFHLRYYDSTEGLRRLAKTRTMPWADARAAPHQRMADADWSRRLADMAGVPRYADAVFDPAAPPLRPWLDAVLASRAGREEEVFTLDLAIMADELWAIPSRFAACF